MIELRPILFLSHSVNAIKFKFKVCDQFAAEYDVESVAMCIGASYDAICESSICRLCTVLGVCVINGKHFC